MLDNNLGYVRHTYCVLSFKSKRNEKTKKTCMKTIMISCLFVKEGIQLLLARAS